MPTPELRFDQLLDALSELYREAARGSPVDLRRVRRIIRLAEEMNLDRRDAIYLINYGTRGRPPSPWRETERMRWERDHDDDPTGEAA